MANEGSKSGAPDLGPSVNGLTEGRKLFGNHYTLIKIVGRGPHSVVWLAWHDKQQRDVALKFLPEATKQDPSALAVLKREVRKLQEIKHPVLVPILEVEEEGTLVAIASEYVEGATLAEMRAQKSNQIFAPADLTESVKQLCTALEYAHNEANHAHGGVTPSNLMVSQKGAFRVTDFALGRHVSEFVSKTSGAAAAGRNLAYLSPQQANGEPATVADDIYSFGATMYELLTSKAPFYTGDIMLQVQQKIPPPMTHRRKELRVIGEPIPRVWEETVASCLQKSPTARPQSITQVREMLGIAADAPATEAAPVAEMAAAGGPSPKTKIIAVAVAAAVICALLAAVVAKSGKPAAGGAGMSAAEIAKQKAEREEAIKKAAKDAEKGAEAKAAAMAEKLRRESEAQAEKLRRESEAKVKQAQAEAERLQKAMEKSRAEEIQRAAAAKKAQDENDAKLKKAQEDAAKAAKSALANTSANSVEAERARKEADDRVKAAEAESVRLKAAIEKAKQDEAKRLADAQKMAKEAEDKIKAAAAEQAKLQEQLKQAQMAKENVELVKLAAIEAEKAKKALAERRAEEEARAREMKAKEDAEAKQMAMLSAKAKKEAEDKRAAQAEARKFKPGSKYWDNSLGIRLAQVGKVYVAIWETRYDDFSTFVAASRHDAGLGWKNPGFKQGATHPVVNVSWSDATAFCKWLTEKERSEGLFSGGTYRLPTDAEWSALARLEGESGATPAERDMKVKGVYPWGNQWPPPVGAGNYQDNLSFDPFDETAPVGSFHANAYGLYDLGGNVWEWCDDWADSGQKGRTLRGGSWTGYATGSALSSARRSGAPTERRTDVGFRIVLDLGK
jgi:formylglycine-generating enzyme required for sulfatase activity